MIYLHTYKHRLSDYLCYHDFYNHEDKKYYSITDYKNDITYYCYCHKDDKMMKTPMFKYELPENLNILQSNYPEQYRFRDLENSKLTKILITL